MILLKIKVKGQGQRLQNNFCPNLSVSGTLLHIEFTDGYELMRKAWEGIEEVLLCFARSSVKFQVHAGQKTPPILTWIEPFTTVTSDWIHRWPQYHSQSLWWHGGGALLFLEVIRQFSRSHGSKNKRLCSDLNVSGWQIQLELTNNYKMTHIASSGMEEVPYSFSRSSVKVRGHPHRIMDNLDLIWARLPSRLQQSKPSDLPYFHNFTLRSREIQGR